MASRPAVHQVRIVPFTLLGHRVRCGPINFAAVRTLYLTAWHLTPPSASQNKTDWRTECHSDARSSSAVAPKIRVAVEEDIRGAVANLLPPLPTPKSPSLKPTSGTTLGKKHMRAVDIRRLKHDEQKRSPLVRVPMCRVARPPRRGSIPPIVCVHRLQCGVCLYTGDKRQQSLVCRIRWRSLRPTMFGAYIPGATFLDASL